MSYGKFQREAGKYSRWRQKSNLRSIGTEKEDAHVRDQWIADERFDELIAYIHTNWDSGNCDEFIKPLEKVLIENQDSDRFIRLWRKIIKYRLDHYLPYTKVGIHVVPLETMDLSNYNPFRPNESDPILEIAHHWSFTLKGLKRYTRGLKKLNQIEEIERVNQWKEIVKSKERTKEKWPKN